MDNTTVPAGTIVVGIDGSASSNQALHWAIAQARLEHRPLTLAYGVTPHTTWLDQGGLDRGMVLDSMRSDGVALLEKARDTVTEQDAGIEVHLVLRLVDPRVLLLDLAHAANLIVLGSHGRGPIRSLLLGSVGLAVSQHATCPVVVLRPHQTGIVRRGVLVGIDDTEGSRTVLEVAYRLASQRSLPLTILHCFWDVRTEVDGPAVVTPGDDSLAPEQLVVAEAVSGMSEKFPDVHVTRTLARGLADNGLVAASRQMDVVVVGSHHRGVLDGLVFGDVSRRVLEHAECVVLVVPVVTEEA
ncbi:putative universal stress protein A [metagenome]|uniref:Putative universal stress protein A n=1 Tax=metagenome TaxID=256318 RepID=A0A2P2BZE8_9ZZZZ